MCDAPLKFIVSCLVYFKKYSAKCDYNQTGRTCPASGACPTSTVRTCPVIKVQCNNDNNWQSFVFYYCILHKKQQCDVALHKVAAHCQSSITLPAVGNGSLSIRPPAHDWRHLLRLSTNSRVTRQNSMCCMKKCDNVWLSECQHVWVSVEMCE